MRRCGVAPLVAIAVLARAKALFAEKHGATAIEYAFVASLISIAIYAVAVTVGTDLNTIFNNVANKL